MKPRPLPRARRTARAALAAALFAAGAWGSGCSLIVSFDGLTRSDSPDGGGGAGGALASCAPGGCIATPPFGFQGPAAFYAGPGDAAPPACAGVALDLGSGPLDAPPATCTPCTCGAPTGQSCGNGTLTAFAGAGCTASSEDAKETDGSGCQPLVNNVGNDWFRSAPVPAMGGSCAPAGGVATVPKATFAERIRLCDVSSADGCSSGERCFEPLSSAYEAKPCIYQMGDVACDAPGYSVKHSANSGVVDSRGCAACSCSPPAGGSCPATTEFYDLPGCNTLITTAHHDGSCTAAGGTESWRFNITGPPSGSSCTASMAAPTGQADPGSSVTICCAP